MEQQNQLGNEPEQITPVEESQAGPEQMNKRSLWRKILAIITILLGILAGFWGGFLVSFSACFKSGCSPVEESAIFTVPIATLFLTIPFAKWLNRNEMGAFKKVILATVVIAVLGFAILWISMM